MSENPLGTLRAALRTQLENAGLCVVNRHSLDNVPLNAQTPIAAVAVAGPMQASGELSGGAGHVLRVTLPVDVELRLLLTSTGELEQEETLFALGDSVIAAVANRQWFAAGEVLLASFQSFTAEEKNSLPIGVVLRGRVRFNLLRQLTLNS
jgi:hypothetical protein